MKKKLILLFAAAFTILTGSCSDDDSPKPGLEPGEIPVINSAPTEYIGREFLNYDTIPAMVTGGPVLFIPQISVKQAGDLKTELVSKYENEFYFTDDAGDKEYRVGGMLPNTSYKNPIGHVIDVYATGDTDFPALALGYFGYGTDNSLIMHWPEKNLKIYLRIYFRTEDIILPENWHGMGEHLNENRNATVCIYGMFVNGVPVKWQHLEIVLQPDGSAKLFGRPDNLEL